MLALGPALLSLLLFGVAETGGGRWFAVTALSLLAVPLVLLRASRRTSIVGLGAFALLYAALVLSSPEGKPLPDSPLRSEFLGEARYPRLRIATLLPEIDQIKLGTYVVPFVDPLIDSAEAARLRDSSMRHYRAMERDREFRALGTVMSYAYSNEDAAHLYAYSPPHHDNKLPLLVFLHGSAGNFKAYFYLWKRFADDANVAIVCPSFGFGNWYERGGTDAVERARTYGVAVLGADEKRTYLVGLSNGGTGVTRAGAEHPERYAGLVFLSAVMEPAVLGRGSFVSGWAGRPILVVHGATDDRIPVAYAREAVDQMRGNGATVEATFVPGEDHFLFFDRDEEVFARVRAWLSR